jgi:general secretion pathway protein I
MRSDASIATREPSAGFTLLEVVIALMILGLSIGVLFQTLSTSLGRLADAKGEALAVSVAQSVLARVGADIPLKTGTQTGTYGEDIRWHVNIEPYVHDGKLNGRVIPAVKVVVTTSWGALESEHEFHLTTIRFGHGD